MLPLNQSQREGYYKNYFHIPLWELQFFGHPILVNKYTNQISFLHESHIQKETEEFCFGIL
jgi:hypothetical protein